MQFLLTGGSTWPARRNIRIGFGSRNLANQWKVQWPVTICPFFVGRGGMSIIGYQTMFALWCLVKSPLMLGSDMTEMTKDSEAYKIISNQRLIAINRDPLGYWLPFLWWFWQYPYISVYLIGIQGTCVKNCCSHGPLGGITSKWTCYYFSHSWQVWRGSLSGGSYAVVVLNRFNVSKDIRLDWAKDAAIPVSPIQEENLYELQDLWSGQIVSSLQMGLSVWEGELQPHQNWAFKLTPVISIWYRYIHM